jgi:hypothetical protein
MAAQLQSTEPWLAVLRGVSLPVPSVHALSHAFVAIKDVAQTSPLLALRTTTLRDINAYFATHTAFAFAADVPGIQAAVVYAAADVTLPNTEPCVW